ncbi:GNAT family N-acetyltransferase [Pseudooctadecabacter sp.]|uniref:GNAT family N-acetyltransferase n=1 Tax=Pseudooctadecabacter sp. TaxID=1966338 RepID=UPI0035C82F71
MTLRSLEMRSELLTMTGVSRLDWFDDYAVQTTPTEPDFWHGNQLILHSNSRTADQVFALFERYFPTASRRAIVWDMPNLSVSDLPDFSTLGGTTDSTDALVLRGTIGDAPVPNGITLRQIEGDAEWAQVLDLMDEVGIEEGYPADTHRPFLMKRNANRQKLIAQDMGGWFGAFDGDQLVAHMGMFHDQTVARYQCVETKITHRRRGICAALLRTAALWALGRAPDAKVTIVAEADSAAGRLYLRMGFAHAETIHCMSKPGY